MEGIVAIIVQALAGAAGGGIAGNMIKTAGMALLPKLISGALGGVAGGSILGAIFSGGAVDPAAVGRRGDGGGRDEHGRADRPARRRASSAAAR